MTTTEFTRTSWYETQIDGKKVVAKSEPLMCIMALSDLFSEVPSLNPRAEFSAEQFEQTFGNPTITVTFNIAFRMMTIELRDDHDKIAQISVDAWRPRKHPIKTSFLVLEDDDKEYPPRVNALIGIKAKQGEDQYMNLRGVAADSVEVLPVALTESLREEMANEVVLPWGEIDHPPSKDMPWGSSNATPYYENAVRGKIAFSDVISTKVISVGVQDFLLEAFKEFIGELVLHATVDYSAERIMFYELRFENEHGQVAGFYGQRTQYDQQILQVALGMKAREDEEESQFLPGTSKQHTKIRSKMTGSSPDDLLGATSIQVPEG